MKPELDLSSFACEISRGSEEEQLLKGKMLYREQQKEVICLPGIFCLFVCLESVMSRDLESEILVSIDHRCRSDLASPNLRHLLCEPASRAVSPLSLGCWGLSKHLCVDV